MQKDWAIIKSFGLDDVVTFVICCHKGWDRNQDIPIYEPIRIENQVEVEV